MISVIIPTYNRAATIKRAAESVLAQTVHDLELIIVDDGSTDNTREIVNSISDERVIYIYQENAGACAARNNGIDHARGEYITFQDSDDAWHPDKLERQIATLKEYGADVCFCRLEKRFVEENRDTVLWPRLDKTALLTREELIKRPIISTQTIIGKGAVFEEYKFDPDCKKGQDYDWAIRASREFSFVFSADVLVDQYYQTDSITMKGTLKAAEAREFLLKKYPEEIKEFPSFYYNQLEAIAFYRTLLNEDTGKYYKKMFSMDHSPETLFKCIMAKLGLLNKYYKVRGLYKDTLR